MTPTTDDVGPTSLTPPIVMTLLNVHLHGIPKDARTPVSAGASDTLRNTEYLVRRGAIQHVEGSVWNTTDLGKAWIWAILRVPPPTVAYIDQDGTVLKSPEPSAAL